MARNFDSDQIIDLINSNSQSLGFYLLEVNDRPHGYQICAATDIKIAGHTVSLIFRRDIIHVSRLYDREEIGRLVDVLATIHKNIINRLETNGEATKNPSISYPFTAPSAGDII
jgi:hypothetical protein